MQKFSLIGLLMLTTIAGCNMPEKAYRSELGNVANSYVKLALGVGQYSPLFVDAYYGPQDWQPTGTKKQTLPYEEFKWQCMNLMDKLKNLDDEALDSLELLRYHFLNKQLSAVYTKLDMMAGKTLPFDVESMALYDAVAKPNDIEYYDSLLLKLDEVLPGKGLITNRYLAFSKQFIIPQTKLDTVFKAAISEARQRVKRHITLPENESFVVEYVTGKPWSAYNWFKGNSHSIIQLNTELPVYINQAIDLACHEGYPGHHVYNTLLEQRLVNEHQWNEFQIYPLFTPQSLIAEGTANLGIELTFPMEDRIRFEKKVLFPLAGLNTEEVEHYYIIQKIRKKLISIEIDIARRYLSNLLTTDETNELLQKYRLFSVERAVQRLEFYNTYRSYIINYSLGEELIRSHLIDMSPDGSLNWDYFIEILSTPRTASSL